VSPMRWKPPSPLERRASTCTADARSPLSKRIEATARLRYLVYQRNRAGTEGRTGRRSWKGRGAWAEGSTAAS
jgi:hypothetical protein